MGINDLNTVWVKLPEWVTWIDCNESLIFITWDKIQAGCKASCWNVITLIKNNANNIINMECDANVTWTNKCWNTNVDSETCVIKLNK
jgi:hypothetical protein